MCGGLSPGPRSRLTHAIAHGGWGQDQAADSTANGKKWYTIALLETLTSVLARVRVPDVDLCVAEEGPQVLRGGNQPVLAATRSSAHMDVLVPDLFFRYWETPPHLVPHPWYKPPFNLASPRVYAHTDGGRQHDGEDFEVGLPWEQRTGKAFWRGSIDEWAMNARGRLCRLAARRPDLFDVEPIRITGRGLASAAHPPSRQHTSTPGPLPLPVHALSLPWQPVVPSRSIAAAACVHRLGAACSVR